MDSLIVMYVESLTSGRTPCYHGLLCQRRQNWVPRQNDSEKNLVRFENQPNYRQTDSEKMLVWFENKRNYRQNVSEKIQVSDLKTSPTTANTLSNYQCSCSGSQLTLLCKITLVSLGKGQANLFKGKKILGKVGYLVNVSYCHCLACKL